MCKKIGNLFELAIKRLIMEVEEGIIPCFTAVDIIDYAEQIREWLDNHPKEIKAIMKLSKRDILIHNRLYRKRYYLENRR